MGPNPSATIDAMQVALFVTALAIFVYLLRRALLARRRPPAPTPKLAPGCIELVGLPLRHLSVDGQALPLLGVTSADPRGFSHVPAGRHRIVVVSEGEARAIEAVVRPGEITRISRDARGALVGASIGRAPAHFDASYIHFPTWARGTRFMLTGGVSLLRGLEDA